MKGPSIAASIPRLKLSSGHYIPQVGFGLWKVPAAQTADAVYGAIKAGYRHIDGAYGYANSAEAGQGVRRAIAHGLVSRDDLFITSKLRIPPPPRSPAKFHPIESRLHFGSQRTVSPIRLQHTKMTGRGGGGGRRVLLPPINFIFKLLQQQATVQVWLYEQLSIRIEGKIRGFDEFMNLVIDNAVEVKQITKTNKEETRRSLGQILLKGDNVSLIQSL
ncbi:Small nuclear ribonucleoprotein E like [Verticillium longisporum]|nr:Small nuclear ribonucleoprotein E like [Verticillium longisporum]